MGSVDGLTVRKLNVRGELHNFKTDQPVAIRIRHKGTAAVTSVTVTAATNLVLIDADGTSTITFADSDSNTVGEVADKVNGLTNWEAIVLDALRSDASASKFVNGAITSGTKDGVVVWDVKVDTSALFQIAVC